MHQQEKKALGEHKGQSSEQCMMCFFSAIFGQSTIMMFVHVV